MLMPPPDHLQYVLPLRLLTPVPHKLHRIVVYSPRGSCQGFWQVPRPVRAPVVASNEGIAARHDAGSRSVVGGHLSPLNSGVVSLKLLLHVKAQQQSVSSGLFCSLSQSFLLFLLSVFLLVLSSFCFLLQSAETNWVTCFAEQQQVCSFEMDSRDSPSVPRGDQRHVYFS